MAIDQVGKCSDFLRKSRVTRLDVRICSREMPPIFELTYQKKKVLCNFQIEKNSKNQTETEELIVYQY